MPWRHSLPVCSFAPRDPFGTSELTGTMPFRAWRAKRPVPRSAPRSGDPLGGSVRCRTRVRDRRPCHPRLRPPVRCKRDRGGQRDQRVRADEGGRGAARGPPGGPIRRAGRDGGGNRGGRGEQHPGRVLPVLRRAHGAARQRRGGFGDVQHQRPGPAPRHRAQQPARPGQRPVQRRLPARRDQRPRGGRLVAAWSLRAPFFIYGCLLVVPAILAAVVLRQVPDRRQAVSARRPARWQRWPAPFGTAPGGPPRRPTWPTASPRWRARRPGAAVRPRSCTGRRSGRGSASCCSPR
jgi:hypothetical protein